jgi:hypothetical protein
MGHRGGAVQHYVFDRCGYSKLRLRTEQWHGLVSGQWSADTLPETEQLPLLEWLLFTPCAAHDCHNACKWGLPGAFGDADLMRDCYIGIDAVRQSFDVILRYIGEWVSTALSPSEPWGEDELCSWRETWSVLGQSSEVVALLCELQLRHADGRLRVSSRAAEAGDIVSKVVAAVLFVWRFQRFTESRWLTVGSSARTMVSAHLTGLTQFLTWVKAKPGVSGFYLNGFNRLTPERWAFLCQAALFSKVPDSALAMLLEDSRVARIADSLRGRLAGSLQELADLPTGVWCVLASVSRGTPAQLQGACLMAAQRAAAFFQDRVLDEAERLPWRLCAGGIPVNLQDLQRARRPDERTAGKIYDLLLSGYPMAKVQRMVELMGDSPWATTVVEQLHASAALVSRHHPDYGLRTLLARASLLTAGKLLPGRTALQKQLARKRAQLARLARRRPGRAGGRQALFRDASERSRKLGRLLTKAQSISFQRRLMQRHGELFRRQPAAVQARYNSMAAVRAQERQAHLLRERERTMAEVQELESRLVEEAQKRQPLSLRAAKWRTEDLETFSRVWSDGSVAGQALQTRRQAACTAPPGMSPSLLAALGAQAVPTRQQAAVPAWWAGVCQHREAFENTVLLEIRDDLPDRFWMVNFARQSPRFVSLTELQRTEPVFHVHVRGARAEQAALDWHLHEFEMVWMRNTSADILRGVDVSAIMVIAAARFQAGSNRWVSDLVPEPLELFLQALPSSRTARAGAGQRAAAGTQAEAATDDAVVQELPWAAEGLRKRRRRREPSPEESAGNPAADDMLEPDDVLETLGAEAMAELEGLRLELQDQAEPRVGDLVVSALGGAWTLANRGVVSDAVRARARGMVAQTFCRAHRLPVAARFELSAYGAEDAAVLARAWCSRMQHLMNLQPQAGGAASAETSPAHDWVEPSEFAQLAERPERPARLSARITQIRALGR